MVTAHTTLLAPSSAPALAPLAQLEDCRQLLAEQLPPEAFAHLAPAEQQAVAFFLRQKGLRSGATRRSYATHLARFLVWLKVTGRDRLDEWVLMDYQQALLAPEAALQRLEMVSFKPVTEETADQYLAPVRSFLAHLADKQLLPYNPAKMVPALGVRRGDALAPSKSFTPRHWAALNHTLDALPGRTPGERSRRARLRFGIRFQYALALRVGEMTTHTQAHLHEREDEGWVLAIVGKGRRARRLPLEIADLDNLGWTSLVEFREALKLAPVPAGEPVPLLPAARGVVVRTRGPRAGVHIQPEGIEAKTWQNHFAHFIERDVMHQLYETPDRRRDGYEAWAHYTPHSLRHTRLTHCVQASKQLLWVQRFAGHESLDTTSIYFQAI